MSFGYWQSSFNRRLNRRRLLAAVGAGASATAILAACSGDEDTPAVSGAVTLPVDETKSAKVGGTMVGATTSDPSAFEVYVQGGGGDSQVTYQRLWRVKDGHLRATAGDIEGDLVESWELSPDRLTLTAKLLRNVAFAPLPPVNGRTVDAQDVVFSWNRHKTMSTSRTDYWQDVAPTAPVTSITAIDDRTISIKLARPTATILSLLSRDFAGDFHIMPREGADRGMLDFREKAIGSGPWYFSRAQPSVGATLKKNPGFKYAPMPDIPYMDTLELTLITEYAQQMAQFRAGTIYAFPAQMKAEDIVQLKRDVPYMEMIKNVILSSRVQRFGFGQAPNSPFRDERIRQAFYAAIDRDLILSVGAGQPVLEPAGLPVETRFESALENGLPGWEGWILDPKDEKSFGPNAVNFKHDNARVKQLMSAAGFPQGIEVNVYTVAPPTAPFFLEHLDTIVEMANESGMFKATRRAITNFGGEFVPKYQGQTVATFDGVAISLSVGVAGRDPANYLFYHYNEAGSRRHGYDQTMTDLTSKAITEFDSEKRRSLVQEIQRYEGKVMFFPRIGAVTSYNIAWPILRNRGVWNGGSGRSALGWGFTALNFLDPSRPPVGKS